VTTAPETTNGQAFITICATRGAQRECIERGLNVFGYRLVSAVEGVAVAPGDTAMFSITAESLGGDVPDVVLSVEGLPIGVTPRFETSDRGTPYAEFPFTTNLVVDTTSDTPSGSYPVRVLGLSQGLARSVDLVLDIIEE
jgi:hypothetical protein